eukprot:TRINITY_DN8610_c0_g1_i1.p1 TRINITY_DN8610_c0_g1~~TRINITY_DN8610_c0_g1_i1.p1  ORF type:complete len:1095 (-),score=332.96 TRINITY_DN8610_c0_g1_i1:700-3957(-)
MSESKGAKKEIKKAEIDPKLITAEPKDTKKREYIRNYEKEVQKFWDDNKVFEIDGVEGEPKWLGTFPYPYMNGMLHLGHAFTAGKVDFSAGYQRLKGKRALFPFGFHCTGMPIKACADKLKREMHTYGNPPNFPERKKEEEQPPVEEVVETKIVDKTKSKKAKVAQKSDEKFQWEIMQSSGIPDSEIPDFSDAYHWLSYFPPKAKEDLKSMGSKIDWRRSFITTDKNPYYDAFIRWQFNKLKKVDKIRYGKRETIFSPLDGQPCMDHDRATGENVGVSEYTLIKQELQRPYPKALASLESNPAKVYLVPATLRPETMYGQTNCWVLPDGDYGAYKINDKEIFVCTARAARNLAFQDMSPEYGKVEELLTFQGKDLIGAAVRAPLSAYPVVYVYPLFSININKTTGVVTSVPSDSPDDCAAFRDVKSKAQLREKFGLTDDMVNPYELVPIIEIPGIGKTAAATIVDQLKIKSQNDSVQLAKAKDIVYKAGFYDGVMLVGEHAGKKVQEAKQLIKASMLASGDAAKYYEPESPVVSRSGDDCVVALCNQWYLNYGEEEWKKAAFECLEKMNTFGEEVRNQFKFSLDWVHEWACSRSFGLGSRMPWDPQYLIESLSDSTIYMAYYTIAHYLQGDIDGKVEGAAKLKPSQLTDEVFEFIFSNGEYPASSGIDKTLLEKMRSEFKAWYPVDLRTSGKDLIPNHLVFWIYNHVGLFPKEQWPTGVKANGHLMLNGSKMSKRTGNFITLKDAIRRYSSDGMRFALAESGDGIEDSNFTTENADAAILRIHTLIEWVLEVQATKDQMKRGPVSTFAERVFEAYIEKAVKACGAAYDGMFFREAIQTGFFDMILARDLYRQMVTSNSNEKMNYDLIEKFIRYLALMMAPITSHTSEHIWRNILGEKDTIFNARFPTPSSTVDESVIHANNYLNSSLSVFREKISIHMKPSKKEKETKPYPKTARVYVTVKFPEWQEQVLNALREIYVKDGALPSTKELTPKLREINADLVNHMKKIVPIIPTIQAEIPTRGLDAFAVGLPFDEKALLEENTEYLRASLKLDSIQVFLATEEALSKESASKFMTGAPGKPLVFFD